MYNLPVPGSPEEQADTQFALAVGQAAGLLARLHERSKADLESMREIVKARELSPDPRYATLEHLVAMSECVADIEGLEYVLFPESANSTWQVYAVPLPGEPFVQKRPFPAEWAGLMGDQLSHVTGVSDALFCHSKRFLAVAKSREGALQLLEQSLATVR